MRECLGRNASTNVYGGKPRWPRPKARVSTQQSSLKEGCDQEGKHYHSHSRQAEITGRHTLAGQARESAMITEIQSQTGKPAVELPM